MGKIFFPRNGMRWGLTGALLLGLHLVFLILSPAFLHGKGLLAQPAGILVAIEILAGTVYFLMVVRRPEGSGRRTLDWILAVGALLRACLFFSTPILEDDFYRYLWDGGVTAAGENPYRFTPVEIAAGTTDGDRFPPGLDRLAWEAGPILERVNHPDLRSVYPPVAQAAFALAHWIRPWSLTAWRLLLLLFDLATLVLLILILRNLRLPPAWMAVYWWNPILIKEAYNSAHMDLIALPFVLAAVWLVLRGRHLPAAAALAIAAGAKLWPVALLPILLRPLLRKPGRLVAALIIFGLLMVPMFLPVLQAGWDRSSGILAFGSSWEMNDALFMVIHGGARMVLAGAGSSTIESQILARGIVALCLLFWIYRQSRAAITGGIDLLERSLLVIAGLFLLIPAQFPWYFLWLLPFLAIRPRASLLLLTPLLPLYYLRFPLAARGRAGIFDFGIVFLEYLPVWILLVREWTSQRTALSQPAGKLV